MYNIYSIELLLFILFSECLLFLNFIHLTLFWFLFLYHQIMLTFPFRLKSISNNFSFLSLLKFKSFHSNASVHNLIFHFFFLHFFSCCFIKSWTWLNYYSNLFILFLWIFFCLLSIFIKNFKRCLFYKVFSVLPLVVCLNV